MDKVKLLMWKNFKILWRTKAATLVEIIVPTVPVLLFIILRVAFKIDEVPEPHIYESFSVSDQVPKVVREMCNVIYYTPTNPMTDKIIKEIKQKYFDNQGLNYTFVGFDRNEKMITSYEETFRGRVSSSKLLHGVEGQVNNDTQVLLAALIFENIRAKSIPSNIKYTIRFPSCQRTQYDTLRDNNNFRPGWLTDFLYPIIAFRGPRSRKHLQGGFPGYYDEGFLYLQNAIDHTISNILLSPEQKKEFDEYEIHLRRFPFPSYREDKFTFTTQSYLPLYMCFSFIYAIMNLTKMIVHEKSTRLKEFMKIMGMDDWVHWTAWYLRSVSVLSVSLVFIVILMKIKVRKSEAIFTEADPLIIFLLLGATIFSLIGFAFFCSTLFDDEQTAATFAGFMWIILEFAFVAAFSNYNKMSTFTKYAITFLASPMPMSVAFFLMGARELAGDGTKWDNLWDGYSTNDSFSIGHAMVMLIINGVIYYLAAFYTQLVFPGKFGVPLPWYFPLTKWYWTGGTRNTSPIAPITKKTRTAMLEKDPTHLKPGIEIAGVSRVFATKIAVNNLSIKMFENQVTSLLGHNGAGKSTTMSILTGLTKPSTGTALVNGFDICKNMPAVRASLGLCPQYNILFDDLTVEEHLKFYCKLKEFGKAETLEEIDRCLLVLGLEDKRHVKSKNLSGGMKRKLCVGMAFAAGSKVVLLDEPTAGMDPGARRSTWDLIQAEKAGRTVLLSTHYMEEADLLGDRIAIMANGQLQCCGSSLFLKSKYGGDYTLIVVKKSECNVDRLKQIVYNIIPDARFKSDVGAEISFILPADYIQSFSTLFEKLDSRKQQLQFDTYGVSSTSMEEVFCRVGLEAEGKNWRVPDDHEEKKNGMLSNGISEESLNRSHGSVAQLYRRDEMGNIGKELWIQQFKAMFNKKLIYALRNQILFVLQVAVPIVMVAYVLWLCGFYPGLRKAPGVLTFTLDEYEKNEKTSTLINCPLNSTACQGYKAFLCDKYNYEDIDDVSLVPVILDAIEKSYWTSTGKNILGFEEALPNENSTKTRIIGYFNNQQLHNSPLALNMISNGLLRAFGLNNEFTVSNYPFDYDDAADGAQVASSFNKPFATGFSMGVALAFLTATFVVFPVQERQTKFKQLQIIAGVKLPIYWLVNFCVDFAIYIICVLMVYGVILIAGAKQYKTFVMFLKFLVVSGFYGWAMICATMLLSKVFKTASSGYSKIVALNASIGFCGLVFIIMMRAPDLNLKSEADAAHTIMLFHPNYALGSGVMYLALQRDLHKYCPSEIELSSYCQIAPEHPCCEKLQDSYFHWKSYGAGRHIFHMGMTGLACLALLYLLESGALWKLKARIDKRVGNEDSYSSEFDNARTEAVGLMDIDVVKEIRRINQSNLASLFNTDNLVVRSLKKTYKGKFQAVKSISFGVPKGETFGLLGSNGAGKTTTFKMLTGDISITSGDAFINSYSVKNNLEKAHAHLGYCPQFDACLDQFTGTETLTIFARLRGILETQIPSVIEAVAEDLLFTKFLDKSFGSYSGGNKRKLSTALAMLGNPSTIFLDEPTAGMDPVACRHVWEAIKRVRDRGTSVVLTSHNMEECEALCSKLGIMVKGQFKCIGSPQRLKDKLNQVYALMVQMSYTVLSGDYEYVNLDDSKENQDSEDNETNEVESVSDWGTRLDEFSEFLRETFPGCFLKDSHPGFAEYHIPQENNTWSKVFGTLEEAKTVFHLDAYTVGQNNLEQVFFNFTCNDD